MGNWISIGPNRQLLFISCFQSRVTSVAGSSEPVSLRRCQLDAVCSEVSDLGRCRGGGPRDREPDGPMISAGSTGAIIQGNVRIACRGWFPAVDGSRS